jgi:sugar porter (SP) family MFS transporter
MNAIKVFATSYQERKSTPSKQSTKAQTKDSSIIDLDDDEGDEDLETWRDTDALLPGVTSNSSSPRTNTTTKPTHDDSSAGPPKLKGSYLLYTSVFITILSGPQLGWEIAQLNLRTFHHSLDCKHQPEPLPGTCIIFPGHSNVQWVMAVTAWVLGAAIGSLFNSYPAEKFGRRFVVLSNAIIMISGALAQTLAPSMPIFILGRLFSGIASGSGSTITSVYLGEIGPAHQKAAFVVGFQCTGSLGLVGITVAHFAVTGTPNSWRWIMFFPVLLGMLQLALAPIFLVESPRWLLLKRTQARALVAYNQLYKSGRNFGELVKTTQEEKEKAARRTTVATATVSASAMAQKASSSSFWGEVISPRCYRQFLISCILCIARQLGGVSAVFYYSSSIFAGAGIPDSRVGNLLLAFFNMISVFIICTLMKKLPRRKTLLYGISGMILSSIGMTFSLVKNHWSAIGFTTIYVMCNSSSLGPLPFLIAAEVLPDHLRTKGMSITTFINWMSNLFVGICFPFIAQMTKNYTFVPFTFLLVLFWLSVYFLLPETHGKTNAEIQQEFSQQADFLFYVKKMKQVDKIELPITLTSTTTVSSTTSSSATTAVATLPLPLTRPIPIRTASSDTSRISRTA